ncbi:ATP-binding protein [Streptomyces polyrhachis]|uniref:histidine kinase n=1 Tax=Streptomyces polyrhachis TaxID=1282885 RepID=A0ABW2GDL0_9ACTN
MTSHQDAARATTSTTRRLRPVLIALCACAALAAPAVTGAVLAAPDSGRIPLAWGLGVAAAALCVAVAAAAHFRETARTLRARATAEAVAASTAASTAAARADARAAELAAANAALTAELAEARRAAVRFADETVPALLTRVGAGASAVTAVNGVRMPADPAYLRVLRQVAEEAARSENRRAGVMAACANAAGRMQALATSMLADLHEMEHRHADAAVLADLLHLDHRTSQAGRLADSIAVLSGARSGRRWAKPIGMESVLRGAMGRVAGYQRVRPHVGGEGSEPAVAGHAAEGVMHLLAEVIDNACTFSPPTTEVHVYVTEVPAGVAVTVEDAGLVMSDTALRRAERVTSGAVTDLTGLTGTRLGLAVVGILARKHGLTVSFRPSAMGGTGVVVMIPQELIAHQDPARGTPQATAPAPQRHVQPPREVADEPTPAPRSADREPDAGHAATPDGADEAPAPAQPPTPAHGTPDRPAPVLPKRNRGRTMASAHPDGLPGDRNRGRGRPADPPADHRTAEAPPAPQPPAKPAAFGAFRQAVRAPEATVTTPAADQPAGHPAPHSPKDDA